MSDLNKSPKEQIRYKPDKYGPHMDYVPKDRDVDGDKRVNFIFHSKSPHIIINAQKDVKDRLKEIGLDVVGSAIITGPHESFVEGLNELLKGRTEPIVVHMTIEVYRDLLDRGQDMSLIDEHIITAGRNFEIEGTELVPYNIGKGFIGLRDFEGNEVFNKEATVATVGNTTFQTTYGGKKRKKEAINVLDSRQDIMPQDSSTGPPVTGKITFTVQKASGLPPGPPPRPGLVWKPETSRWIRPREMGDETEERRPSINPEEEKKAMREVLDQLKVKKIDFEPLGVTLDAETITSMKENADIYLNQYERFFDASSYNKIRNASYTLINEARNAKLGVSPPEIQVLVQNSIDKLVYQEMRAWERQLSDHGIRHISGNITTSSRIGKALNQGGVKITPKQMFMITLMHINHDLGYTMGEARHTIEGTKRHKEFTHEFIETERDFFLRFFSSDEFDVMQDILLGHDDTEIDWENDPVKSIVSVSDNLSLFHEDKLPSLFRYIEGALDDLYKIQEGLRDGNEEVVDEVKKSLGEKIGNAKLPAYTKAWLERAVGEVSKYTAKFTMPMLVGKLEGFEFQKDQGLIVDIEEDLYDSKLADIFDMGQAQYVKFAQDYRVTLEDKDDVTFEKEGKPAIRVRIKRGEVKKSESTDEALLLLKSMLRQGSASQRIRVLRLLKGRGIVEKPGPAPGPSPRPGLEWKPETHRWVRPEEPKSASKFKSKLSSSNMSLFERQEIHRTSEAWEKYFHEIPESKLTLNTSERCVNTLSLIRGLSYTLNFESGKDKDQPHMPIMSIRDENTGSIEGVLIHTGVKKDGSVYLDTVAVNPKRIIEKVPGAGSELMYQFFKEVLELGAKSVNGYPLRLARGFYQHVGFTMDHERMYINQEAMEEYVRKYEEVHKSELDNWSTKLRELELDGVEAGIVEELKKTKGVPTMSGPPPGPPPRPGLEWKPQSHRWIIPERLESDKSKKRIVEPKKDLEEIEADSEIETSRPRHKDVVPFDQSPWDFKKYRDAPDLRRKIKSMKEVKEIRDELWKQVRLNPGSNTVTLYHVTLEDYADNAAKEGLIPGREKAPGQQWKAEHSDYATYFHSSAEVAFDQADQEGEGTVVVEARIPITPKSLIRFIPDEDSGVPLDEGVDQLVQGFPVAYIGGIPAESLIIHRGEDIQDRLEKARGVPEGPDAPPGPPPRPGLEWKPETHRWIRPDKEEFVETKLSDPEAFEEVFQPRGPIKETQKKRIRKKLVEKYGEDPVFKTLAGGLAFFTNGFYEHIRKVAGALVTDTVEDLEANATGYFRSGLLEESEDPMIALTIFARIQDIYGYSSDEEYPRSESDHLKSLTYKNAQRYGTMLIHAINNAKPTNTPLYRGIAVSTWDMPKYSSGDIIDLPEPTSFTRDQEIAEGFAAMDGKGIPKSRHESIKKGRAIPILIEVIGENKALDIDTFSYWAQQEVLTNGEFEVVDFVDDAIAGRREAFRGKKLTLKQRRTANFDDWEKGRGVEYTLPKEIAKDLSLEEYDLVRSVHLEIQRQIKHSDRMAEKYGKREDERNWMFYPSVPERVEVDYDKVNKKLKQLGYRVAEDMGAIYHE